MEGWVKRRASHRQWIWHSRYLVLNPAARILLYYSKKNDITPKKSFALHPNCKISDPVQRDSGSEVLWCFRIKFEKGSLKYPTGTASAGTVCTPHDEVNDSDEPMEEHVDSRDDRRDEKKDDKREEKKDEKKDDKREEKKDDKQKEEKKEKLSRKARLFGDPSVLELAVPSFDAAEAWVAAIRHCVQTMAQSMTPRTASQLLNAPNSEADYGDIPGAFRHIVDLRSTESPLRSSNVSVELVDQGLTVYRERSEDQHPQSKFEIVSAFNYNLYTSLAFFVVTMLAVLVWPFNVFTKLLIVIVGCTVSARLVFNNMQHRRGETPVYLAGFHVRGSPEEVHGVLVSDAKNRFLWDGASVAVKVLEKKDDHVDIIHIQQRAVFIWPFWYKPRDFVCIRYWARETDGSYVVVMQSTTHQDAPVDPKFVRAEVLFWSYLVCPLKPEYLSDDSGMVTSSYVVQTIRFDPRGWILDFSLFKHCSYRFVAPMLTSLLSLSSYMRSKDFVDAISRSRVAAEPSLLQSVKSRTQSRTDKEKDETMSTASSASRDSVIDDDTDPYPPGVSAVDGIIQGVPRAPNTIPSEVIMEPDATKYSIRGPSYLSDRIKIPARPAMFRLIAADIYSFENPAERPNLGPRSRICQEADRDHDNDALFTFVAVIIPPSTKNYAVAMYYQPICANWKQRNPKFAELFTKFIEGNDQYRNQRFKLIPDLVQGPYVLRAALRTRPAIPGTKRVDMGYYRGKNWFEVDIDVSGQNKAKYITTLALPVAKSLIVDLAFLIESQSVSELPEEIIGVVRFDHTDLSKAVRIAEKTQLLPPLAAILNPAPAATPSALCPNKPDEAASEQCDARDHPFETRGHDGATHRQSPSQRKVPLFREAHV